MTAVPYSDVADAVGTAVAVSGRVSVAENVECKSHGGGSAFVLVGAVGGDLVGVGIWAAASGMLLGVAMVTGVALGVAMVTAGAGMCDAGGDNVGRISRNIHTLSLSLE